MAASSFASDGSICSRTLTLRAPSRVSEIRPMSSAGGPDWAQLLANAAIPLAIQGVNSAQHRVQLQPDGTFLDANGNPCDVRGNPISVSASGSDLTGKRAPLVDPYGMGHLGSDPLSLGIGTLKSPVSGPAAASAVAAPVAAAVVAPAAMPIVPQKQFDPDKKLVWQNHAWVSASSVPLFIVQGLGGSSQIWNSTNLNPEIIDWTRYNALTKQLKGMGLGWFTTAPKDHPVYVRLPDGRVVSPDCITQTVTDPDGNPLTFAPL